MNPTKIPTSARINPRDGFSASVNPARAAKLILGSHRPLCRFVKSHTAMEMNRVIPVNLGKDMASSPAVPERDRSSGGKKENSITAADSHPVRSANTARKPEFSENFQYCFKVKENTPCAYYGTGGIFQKGRRNSYKFLSLFGSSTMARNWSPSISTVKWPPRDSV